MLIKTYMSATDYNDFEKFKNGIKIEFDRIDNEELIEITLEDDGAKNILSFYAPFEEIKKCILKLE